MESYNKKVSDDNPGQGLGESGTKSLKPYYMGYNICRPLVSLIVSHAESSCGGFMPFSLTSVF